MENMTQALFECCLDFYLDMDDQRKAMKFMGGYSQFADAYEKKIKREISKTEHS